MQQERKEVLDLQVLKAAWDQQEKLDLQGLKELWEKLGLQVPEEKQD